MLNLFNLVKRYLVKSMEKESDDYQQRIYNNFDNLYKYIRKGDVVLVEGRSKISKIIKLFSNSHWSHIVIYIGDELIRRRRNCRDKYLQTFGDEAKHLVIEAFTGKGVIASPIKKYQDYNIRICRPFGIKAEDLRSVIEKVIGDLGRRYDQQNIIDIALMLLPKWLNPFKKRSIKACLGSCNEFDVICSGMIAKALQEVGYPVNPVLGPHAGPQNNPKKNPFAAKLLRRHFSQILPRDFDLSPNFEIIKFNIIKGGRFNYKSLQWDSDYADPEERAAKS